MNFAFGFADPKDVRRAKALASWVAWKHRDEIANKAVNPTSVDAALDEILANLVRGDKIDAVWIYAFADETTGQTNAPLEAGRYAVATPLAVSQFAHGNPKCAQIGSATSASTTLSLYGVDASKSRESLGAWRQVFASRAGQVVAPKSLWQIGGAELSADVSVPVAKKSGCAEIRQHVVAKSRADLATTKNVLAAAIDVKRTGGCLSDAAAASASASVPSRLDRDLEKTILAVDASLRRALEVPKTLRPTGSAGGPSRANVIDAYWDLLDRAEVLVYPFLAAKRVAFDKTVAAGLPSDAERTLGALLPESTAWAAAFERSVPGTIAGTPEAVTADQTVADALVLELRPIFREEFSVGSGPSAKPYNKVIGTDVPVKVLDRADFEAEFVHFAGWLNSEDVRALVAYRTGVVQAALDRAKKIDSGLRGTYPAKITSTTKLDPEDATLLFSSGPPRGTRGRAAGFYSAEKHALFLLDGQVDVAVIAHELCHAYAAGAWNDVQLELGAFGLVEEINRIDEAVASELANVVLLTWARRRSGGAPVARPDGYVGYHNDVRDQGAKFVAKLDGTSTAGTTTMEAYFGGNIAVIPSAKKPVEWEIVVGRARKRFVIHDLLYVDPLGK